MEKMEHNSEKPLAVSSVDAVGLFCPVPIVKLKLALEKLKANQVVEISADDPAFPEDLASWCAETGNKLRHMQKGEDCFVAYVEKG